jgi:putative transposase
MAAILAPEGIDRRAACDALGVARSSVYRTKARGERAESESVPALRSPRALEPEERTVVLETLTSEQFVDEAPRQVWARLLDEGVYLCSVSTMYRVLRAESATRERRDQLRHPAYAKPELLATGPNQVWSWDITKLLGPAKWQYFYLYVILDIFSRYAVGWMVAERESARLAERLIEETVAKQEIEPGQLTLHADRGSSMKSGLVAQLLADLGVTKTHSRPHVSDDNPYSESQFKTMKYRPTFPDRFGSLEDAQAHCRAFFRWYNEEHYHTGIGLHTPASVHSGLAADRNEQRAEVLLRAAARHPMRFVRQPPAPPVLPSAVWINPPKQLPIPTPDEPRTVQ